MKLLLDQNISRKLVKDLQALFPESSHVYLLGLHQASDEEIWNYARQNGSTIVTYDSDFNDRTIVYGYPPKVIWLKIGNTSSQTIKRLLQEHKEDILLFENDKTLGCLQIYSL